jgi:hypothetical protein
MSANLPKVMKDAQRARKTLEQAIDRMARRDKYSRGARLSEGAEQLVMAIHDFWCEKDVERKREYADAMCRRVDALKFNLQLAQDLDAFRSQGEFWSIFQIVESVGSQCGGLRRGIELKGQNDRAAQPRDQRAQILSARNASPSGATP